MSENNTDIKVGDYVKIPPTREHDGLPVYGTVTEYDRGLYTVRDNAAVEHVLPRSRLVKFG